MSPDGFVYDYWNHFSHLPTSELGDSYFAVGRSGSVPSHG
jgi:UDP-N-acetyl-D-mannosaminuronic acid dehydrogenase